MSIPLKLFLVLDGNGNAFPKTSAQSGAYFQLRIVDVEIPFSIILKLAFIDKLSPRYSPLFCFHLEHQIEVGLDADVSENILPFESPSINNFSGIDISQGLDREFPFLSPYFLLMNIIIYNYVTN